MRDKPHVRLVYAQAEGNRRHHDDAILAQEALLMPVACLRRQAGVVGQGVETLLLEPRGHTLDALAGQAIDNAGIADVLAAQELQQLLPRVRFCVMRYWMFGRSKPLM